jgi:hypothetical protein
MESMIRRRMMKMRKKLKILIEILWISVSTDCPGRANEFFLVGTEKLFK